jgi:hypothetical protein
MVVDALITEAAAARQRGIAVLADTGQQIEAGMPEVWQTLGVQAYA